MTEERFVCPCCGYPGLDQPAYNLVRNPPFPKDAIPPYCPRFGDPSYDVCSCCGFEFGNDDDPGTAPPCSFEDYLRIWVANGCRWFDPTKRTEDWDLRSQLANAGIASCKVDGSSS